MANSKFYIIPDKRTVTSGIKESGSSFMCPSGTIMTGRTHTGDENGNTQYEYSTLKAINSKGEVIIGSITIEDIEWDAEFKESSEMGYDAPVNRVVVGRQHIGDENGNTRYQTGVVLFNGKQTTVLSASTLLANVSLKESGGTFFRSTPRFILLGRTHTGDENGKTTYYQGYIRIDK